MSNEKQETIADIVAQMRLGVKDWRGERVGVFDCFADRIEAAHELEKRKFEFALDIQKNNVAKLCELLKEFADVLSDTKNYACFGCTIRDCPGEHECRYTKKYCLLVDKSREAIGGTK